MYKNVCPCSIEMKVGFHTYFTENFKKETQIEKKKIIRAL